jgi:hypothetical protein
MRKSRPKQSVNPGAKRGAEDRHSHYGDAVADEREERTGASSGQGRIFHSVTVDHHLFLFRDALFAAT